jgi:hypothetical protein
MQDEEVIRGKCGGCGRVLIIERHGRRMVTRHEAPLCERFKDILATSKTARRLPDYHERVPAKRKSR